MERVKNVNGDLMKYSMCRLDAAKNWELTLFRYDEIANCKTDNAHREFWHEIEGLREKFADAQATIAALQARVQELEAVLAGDLELTKLHYEPGKPLELQAKHPLIAVMAASMAQMCDDMKAENYVEVQFNHHEKGHFILTVQKMFHPTPHQLRQKAESQLTQRTAECDALKLVNDTHMKTVMKLSHIVEQQTAALEAVRVDNRTYINERHEHVKQIEQAAQDEKEVGDANTKG